MTVEYFEKGEYIRVTGVVTRIDETSKVLKVVNTKIRFEDIGEIRREENQGVF